MNQYRDLSSGDAIIKEFTINSEAFNYGANWK